MTLHRMPGGGGGRRRRTSRSSHLGVCWILQHLCPHGHRHVSHPPCETKDVIGRLFFQRAEIDWLETTRRSGNPDMTPHESCAQIQSRSHSWVGKVRTSSPPDGLEPLEVLLGASALNRALIKTTCRLGWNSAPINRLLQTSYNQFP